MNPKPHNQSGAALFIILIAVALFAALGYAISQSGRSSGNIDKEKVTLEASSLVQYAGMMQQVVLRLQLANRCADTQISFENPTVSGYTNASAPADKACHVFDTAGGGMKYTAPKSAWFGDTYAGLASFVWSFSGNVRVYNLGTGNPELIMALNHVNNVLCMAINDKLGIPNNGSAPPSEPFNNIAFTGSYAADPGPVATDGWPHQIGDDNANFRAQPMGCAKSYGDTANAFYTVLITR